MGRRGSVSEFHTHFEQQEWGLKVFEHRPNPRSVVTRYLNVLNLTINLPCEDDKYQLIFGEPGDGCCQ